MDSDINRERLEHNLQHLAQIGADATGGITRPFGSEADRTARSWLAQWIQEAHFDYEVDGAGNQWGRWWGSDPNAPEFIVGSHLDTVPHGGAFDGAGGVLLSLEALQAIFEAGYRPRHTLALVALTGEEPNPFGLSTLGSRLITGKLQADTLMGQTGESGQSLQEALLAVGGDLTRLQPIHPERIAAFIEPHVEQSGRLDQAQWPLGVVDRITGIYRDKITLIGEQNHSGTTPLAQRKDALQAFGEAVRDWETLLNQAWPHWMVGTIGQVGVYPNAINIVPSRVDFVIELRCLDMGQLHEAVAHYHDRLQHTMKKRGIKVTVAPLLDQAPADMSSRIRDILVEQTLRISGHAPLLSSWAGHDATHFSRVVPTGMLFIRSVGGKSHCPQEYSHLDDLTLGAEVIASTLKRLDGEVTSHVSPL